MKICKTEKPVLANKVERSRLGFMAEEMLIPWKKLNKIAKEVVGREFGDCSRLTPQENRNVIKFLKQNYTKLANRKGDFLE